MEYLRNQSLSDAQLDALYRQAEQRTVPLKPYGDPSRGGSAVKVQLGPRRFLATAGHVIAETPVLEVVMPAESKNLTGLGNRRWTDESSDVGFVEIPSKYAMELAPFVQKNNLIARFPQRRAVDAIVSGFPGALHLRSPIGMGVGEATHHLAVLPVSKWPRNLERKPDPDNDIYVAYPTDTFSQTSAGSQLFSTDRARRDTAPPPGGLSGCGIWALGVREEPDTNLWSPDLQLIGIQHHHLDKWELLRGTILDKWLDLIGENYPDLKSEIDSIRKRA